VNAFFEVFQGRLMGLVANPKALYLLPLLFLFGCAASPQMESVRHAQPLGDLLKCANEDNQHLPTCYCHNMALKENPDRQKICAASLDSWLRDQLIDSPARSMEFVLDLRLATAKLEKFQREEIESWSDATSNYLAGAEVLDDCDAADSLLDIAFTLGGFRLDELAKVLVDTNPDDNVPADHYVAAILVEGKWMMLDYFINEAQPLEYLEFGGYETKYGTLAAESEAVAFRLLSHAQWQAGLPPRTTEEVQFLASL
tara:strand:+ start:958 stop:1725 length:768 start_codon:yes stop_codon:yes gene_type:complete